MSRLILQKNSWLTRNLQLVVIIIIVLISLVFSIQMRLEAPNKISLQLQQAIMAADSSDIEVYFNFTPEDFHIKHFQKIGNVIGVEDNRITVLDVKTEDIWRSARTYWVNRIDLRN